MMHWGQICSFVMVAALPQKAQVLEDMYWCGLTFELRRDRRKDARPGLAKMYRVPPGRAWWLAVGPRLERGVRRRCDVCANNLVYVESARPQE